MAGRIYLLNGESKLIAMEESPYDSETLLQKLLADHPDLLAGDQINAEEPRRWLLVTREMAVPGEQDGAGRWSLDHLFLDQDAIPTLVEVKRSTDTRIRREVVGQMLDYAANAVAYWPVEEVRARFEGRCKEDGLDPEAELAELPGRRSGRPGVLAAGEDEPPGGAGPIDLHRRRDPARVAAGRRVPQQPDGPRRGARHRGQAVRRREPQDARPPCAGADGDGTPEEERRPGRGTAVGRGVVLRRPPCRGEANRRWRSHGRLLEWAKEHGLRIWWGEGKKDGSFFPMYDNRFGKNFLFSVWTYGTVELQFQHMRRPPFSEESERKELADRLATIAGVSIPEAFPRQATVVRARATHG